MLIGNYSVLNKNPGFQISGSTISDVRTQFNKNGSMLNAFLTFDKKSGMPLGYLPPYSWRMPIKNGGLGSFTLSYSAITPSVSMAGGRNLEGSSALTITVTNAQLDQIVSAVGSAALTMAVNDAILAGAANLDADGNLTLAVDSALCGAIISVLAPGSCTISGTGSALTALGFMEAEAGGPTPLSPEGLANAVWDTVLADHVETGTTGAALSDAGGAGNPWSADLSSNNTPGTFGAFVQKLLSVAKFLGLK